VSGRPGSSEDLKELFGPDARYSTRSGNTWRKMVLDSTEIGLFMNHG
jgi:hypothetical protein